MPAFLDLVGRSVVVCAGDARAAAFAQACLEAGAGVVVAHPAPSAAMAALAPRVRLTQRRWRAADFKLASLVVVGHDERRVNQARSSAKAARAMFLMLDGSAASDFSLGEAAVRGPLTIGVATTGLPGELAAALRDRIEAAAPHRLTAFLEAAVRSGAALGLPAGRRAQFWTEALAAAAQEPPPTDWDAWLAQRAQAAAIDR